MSETRQEAFEDTGGPVFQPDTVLPSQFFATLRQKGFVEGEKRLMAAVLSDAVECYMKQVFAAETRAQQIFRDAEAWIFEEQDGPWFFSFLNVCDMLGLEAEYIRRGLLEWRQKRTPTIRPADAFRRAPRTSRTNAPSRELKKAG